MSDGVASGRGSGGHWTDHAVLLYGSRKAGTTLLQNLLDGGEDLLVYPNEVKLKILARAVPHDTANLWRTHLLGTRDPLKRNILEDGSAAESHLGPAAGSLSGTALLDRMDVEGYRQSVRNWCRHPPRARTLREVLQSDVRELEGHLKERSSSLRGWAMKEVGGDPVAVIGAFRTLFPDGPVVVITRNPLFVVRSVLRDRRKRELDQTARDILRQVFDAFQKNQAYARLADKSNVYFLRYEDLVSGRVEDVMSGVAVHLGIRPGPFLSRPSVLGMEVVVKTSSRRTTEVFNPQDVGWTDGLTAREIWLVRLSRGLWRLFLLSKGERYVSYEEVSRLVCRTTEGGP